MIHLTAWPGGIPREFTSGPRARRTPSGVRLLWCALLLAVSTARTSAAHEQATIVATASATKVQVAEPFTMEWTVTAPTGAKVTFPSIAKQLGEFDVDESTDLFDIPLDSSSDTRTWTRRLRLESIVTGDLTIPAMEVRVTNESSQQVLKSKPVAINVTSVLEERGDPTKFRDIQSVVDVDVPERHSNAWFWWTVGGVSGLSVLAIAAVTVLRRRTWVTPKAWAFEELTQLEKSVETSSGDSEAVALRLSDILRTFLLLEFEIADSGYTPDELLQAIDSANSFGTEIHDRLKELFSLADQAKFAGLAISSMEFESALSDARKLVAEIAERNEASDRTRKNRER